jgi:uncharacterized membrane protein
MKKFFKRGLAALLPTILTIFIMVVSYNFVYENIAEPINDGIKAILVNWGRGILESVWKIDLIDDDGTPSPYYEPSGDADGIPKREINWEKVYKKLDEVYYPIIGFVIALILVFVFGFFLASFVGSKVFRYFENLLSKTPIIRGVYPYARQVVDFFLGEEKKVKYSSVVAVQYPKKGIYSIGFVTGSGIKNIDRTSGKRHMSVFIPNSPAPMTGFTIFVPIDEIVPLNMTVDEALRLVISGGVLVPSSQKVAIGPRELTFLNSPPADDEEEPSGEKE